MPTHINTNPNIIQHIVIHTVAQDTVESIMSMCPWDYAIHMKQTAVPCIDR